MIVVNVAAALFAMLPAAAVVQEQEQAQAQMQSEKPSSAEKKRCKMIVPTGSIMAKRFCLTDKEWREFDEIGGKGADAFLSRRGTGTCDIKCPTS